MPKPKTNDITPEEAEAMHRILMDMWLPMASYDLVTSGLKKLREIYASADGGTIKVPTQEASKGNRSSNRRGQRRRQVVSQPSVSASRWEGNVHGTVLNRRDRKPSN